MLIANDKVKLVLIVCKFSRVVSARSNLVLDVDGSSGSEIVQNDRVAGRFWRRDREGSYQGGARKSCQMSNFRRRVWTCLWRRDRGESFQKGVEKVLAGLAGFRLAHLKRGGELGALDTQSTFCLKSGP